MVFLKEDGSLDIERINSLPVNEYMDTLGSLTGGQLDEYLAKLPKDESSEPMSAIKVDFEFDDERSGVDADEYLEEKKKKYGIK